MHRAYDWLPRECESKRGEWALNPGNKDGHHVALDIMGLIMEGAGSAAPDAEGEVSAITLGAGGNPGESSFMIAPVPEIRPPPGQPEGLQSDGKGGT